MKSVRLNSIDMLRGVAALLVVWQHTSATFSHIPEISAQGTLLADLALSVDFGRIGVVCFFLISGFVIPFSFSQGKGALKKFVTRRFFRLYPVYWLSIVFAVCVTSAVSKSAFDSNTILANLTMLQKFFGEPHIQGLYWTLQAELIFYAVCAGLFAIGIHKNPFHHLYVCLLILILFFVVSIVQKKLTIFHHIPKELIYIPYVLAIMFSGTILRALWYQPFQIKQKLFLLLGPICTFGIPIIVMLLGLANINVVDNPTRFGVSHLLGLGVFCAGFFLLKSEQRVFLWVGTISYSIYLFHPIATTAVHWIRVQEWAANFSSLHMGFYMLAVLIITLVLSTVTYICVEKPSINLSYRLTQKLPNTNKFL